MDLKAKIEEIRKEVTELETDIEAKKKRLTLLKKSGRGYQKLLDQAQELEKPS